MKEKLIPKTKKQKTNFKNVELSDIEKIVSIEADCHISPWSKRNFLDSISAGNLFQVLKDDELIIGYYIASFAADECELLNITVKKHFHRQGFGKIIISHLVKNCLVRKVSNFETFCRVEEQTGNSYKTLLILLFELKKFSCLKT